MSTFQQRIKKTATSQIREKGESLVVTTLPTTDSGTSSTASYYFLPQPLTVQNATRLHLEGIYNLAEGVPHDFVADGSAVVAESKSQITYNGFVYRILTVIPERLSGITITQHCVGVRERPT